MAGAEVTGVSRLADGSGGQTIALRNTRACRCTGRGSAVGVFLRCARSLGAPCQRNIRVAGVVTARRFPRSMVRPPEPEVFLSRLVVTFVGRQVG